MIKSRIIVLVMSLLLVFGAASVLVACGTNDGRGDSEGEEAVLFPKPDCVRELNDTGGQQISGVSIKNYTAFLYAETDWAGMSDAERQAVIDYTFNEAYKRAKENDVRNYKIMGVRAGDLEMLFSHDVTTDQVVIMNNLLEIGRVPAPKNPY